MAQYERLKLSIVLFDSEDVVRTSLGDNQVPELGDGTGDGNNSGGIFGNGNGN